MTTDSFRAEPGTDAALDAKAREVACALIDTLHDTAGDDLSAAVTGLALTASTMIHSLAGGDEARAARMVAEFGVALTMNVRGIAAGAKTEDGR